MKYIFIGFILFSLTLPGQNTILWEVIAPNGKISYLVGTMHQLGNSFVDSLPIIKQKLIGAELAVFEMIEQQRSIISEDILSRIDNYDYKQLRKNDIEVLDSISKDWNYPLKKMSISEILAKLEGDYYVSHCGNVKPDDEWKLFDFYLMHIAEQSGIPMIGLESFSDQLAVINATEYIYPLRALRRQVAFWIDALQDSSDDTLLCKLAYEYRALEMDYRLDRECTDDIVFKQRNDKWMKTLPELLASRSCFVAVGLGHLMETCGLIQQLRANGFTLMPVEIHP